MNLEKTYPLFFDWFDSWRNDKAGWPRVGKTRTAAGLLLLWHENAISTLDEIAGLADMTVNSLRVARTDKGFNLVCRNAAVAFCSYLFVELGLSVLKENEAELFHTLDGLNEEAAKTIFEIAAYPHTGLQEDDRSTCKAYLAARDFLLQICWLTLSRSKNVPMNWKTRDEATRYLDKSLTHLRRLQLFYAEQLANGHSVQHPNTSKFWKK